MGLAMLPWNWKDLSKSQQWPSGLIIRLRLTFCKSYTKRRIYLCLVVMNENKDILLNKGGLMPTLEIISDSVHNRNDIIDEFSVNSEEFIFTHLVNQDWLPGISDVTSVENPFSFTHISLLDRFHEASGNSSASTRFRKLYYRTVMAMCDSLGLANFGFLHHVPIFLKKFKCHLLLHIVSSNIDSIPEATLQAAKFQWKSFKSMNDDYYMDEDFPWTASDQVYLNRCKQLKPGIYLVMLECYVTMGGISTFLLFALDLLICPVVLIDRQHPTLPPVQKISDGQKLPEEDAKALLNCYVTNLFADNTPFIAKITSSINKLGELIGSSLSHDLLVSPEALSVGSGVHFLVMCRIAGLGSKSTPASGTFEYIPLQLFEILHFNMYDGEKYREKVRVGRLAREQAVANGHHVGHHSFESNDPKNRVSLDIDGKWTKRAIQFASHANQTTLARPTRVRQSTDQNSK